MIHRIECYKCGHTHSFTSESLSSSEAKHWKKRHDTAIEILEKMHDEVKARTAPKETNMPNVPLLETVER